MTTPAPDELYLVLEAFKPALRSVDFRCIAVTRPSEEHWRNLVTSVSFSDKTEEEAKAEQERIPKIRNKFFRLFCRASRFSYRVLENIAKGELRIPEATIGRHRIRFRKSGPFGLKVESSREPINGSYTWRLSATDSGSEEGRRELWSIVNEQSRLSKESGFDNIPEMVQHCLRTRYQNNDRKDLEVVIYPTVNIENLQFGDSSLEVILKKPSKLKGLQLNLRAMRENVTIWRRTREIEFQKTEFRDNPEVFDIKKLLPFDFLNIGLIHRESGLTLDEKHGRVPIENVAEPFLKTIDAFCPLTKLKKMLLEPEKYGKSPEKIFENAVTWLLSLAGYETVNLGIEIKKLGKKKGEKFDRLYAESGYHIGSADIIAYEGNERLLLIDCDIKTVDPKKVQGLAELKKHFRRQLEGYEKLPIVPILFSPRDFRKTSPSIDVMVAHRSVIERIFEAVVQGNREKARSLLRYSGF